jgi:alpha-methylacyl-CoA racemase
MQEAMDHPHNLARNTFIDVEGVRQPAPAPRFSRTVPTVRRRGAVSERDVLADLGFSEAEISSLVRRPDHQDDNA